MALRKYVMQQLQHERERRNRQRRTDRILKKVISESEIVSLRFLYNQHSNETSSETAILKREEKKENRKRSKKKRKRKEKEKAERKEDELIGLCALRNFDIRLNISNVMEEEILKVDWKQFINWFNMTLAQYNSAIPPIKYITKGKKSQIQKIVNAIGTKHVLIDASIHMMKSDLLNGRVRNKAFPNGFIGSFAWLMDNDERMADVANGTYDNPPEQAPTAEDMRRIKAEERERMAEQRREEARRIEEEEAAARERQREYDRAHAAKGEELQRILAEIELPPLRENEKSPKQRIFS